MLHDALHFLMGEAEEAMKQVGDEQSAAREEATETIKRRRYAFIF